MVESWWRWFGGGAYILEVVRMFWRWRTWFRGHADGIEEVQIV